MREPGRERGPVGGQSQGLPDGRALRLRGPGRRARLGVVPGQQRQADDPGDGERPGVEQERRPQRDPGDDAAEGRADDAAEQEAALEQALRPTPLAGGHRAQQQGCGADGEDGRADAADPPQQQELQVGLRQPGQRGGDRDRTHPDRQHPPLAEVVHQPPAAEGGEQPGSGEDRDDRTGGGVADAEALGEQRDRRGDDAEAERDGHGDRHQHPDLAGEVGERVRRTAQGQGHVRDGRTRSWSPCRVRPLPRRSHRGRYDAGRRTPRERRRDRRRSGSPSP